MLLNRFSRFGIEPTVRESRTDPEHSNSRSSQILRAAFDGVKTERIARELVADIALHARRAMIQLGGHGCSGKRTALVLIATRLATQYGARVLVLTSHHALRGDSGHILAGMPEAAGLVGSSIHVDTATSFLLDLVEAAGGTTPRARSTIRERTPSLRKLRHSSAPTGAGKAQLP